MKKVISFLVLMALSAVGYGQLLQKNSTSFYFENHITVGRSLGIPSDTFSVPVSEKGRPHIAFKDASLYRWDTTFKSWTAYSSGAPAVDSFFRIPGKDSMFFTKNGITYALKDSLGGGAAGWGLTGNVGTVPGTNFIGTTDAQALVFKTSNIEAGRFNSAGELLLGNATDLGAYRLQVNGNAIITGIPTTGSTTGNFVRLTSGGALEKRTVGESVLDLNALTYSGAVFSTNPHVPKRLFISELNDALFFADKRWLVTCSLYLKTDSSFVSAMNASNIGLLFDGDYETKPDIPAGQYAKILIDFSATTYFPGYPYGTTYLSFYSTSLPDTASKLRVYSNYVPHGVGWHEIPFSSFPNTGNKILQANAQKYAISLMEITVSATDTFHTEIAEIDLALDRASVINEMPFIDKYKVNKMYSNFDMNNRFILNIPSPTLNGHAATKKYVDSTNGIFADISPPSTPAFGSGIVYVNLDSIWFKNDVGLATNLMRSSGGGSQTWQQSLTTGSTLTQNNTATQGDFAFTHTGNGFNGTILNVDNTGPNDAIALDVSGTGASNTVRIQNTSGSGDAIFSNNSGTGNAIEGWTTTAAPFYGRLNTGNASGIDQLLLLHKISTAGGSNGIGGAIDFNIKTSTSTARIANRFISKWKNATDASRESEVDIMGVDNAIDETFLNIQRNIIRFNNNQDTAVSQAELRAAVAGIGGGGSGWGLTGNAGTTAGTNFIGTTDNVDFLAMTGAVERLRVKTWPKIETSSKFVFGGTPGSKIIAFRNDVDSNAVRIYYNDTTELNIENSRNGGNVRITTGSPTGGFQVVGASGYAITSDNTGRVGIGKISASQALDVNGNIVLSGYILRPDITTPATPDANLIVDYVNADRPRFKDDGGNDFAYSYYSTTSEASNASPTPKGNARSNNHFITALATGATFNAPSGTAVNGNLLLIRIKDDGTARPLAFNPIYRAVDIALPTTTVSGKYLYLGFIHNDQSITWDLVTKVENF